MPYNINWGYTLQIISSFVKMDCFALRRCINTLFDALERPLTPDTTNQVRTISKVRAEPLFYKDNKSISASKEAALDRNEWLQIQILEKIT